MTSTGSRYIIFARSPRRLHDAQSRLVLMMRMTLSVMMQGCYVRDCEHNEQHQMPRIEKMRRTQHRTEQRT